MENNMKRGPERFSGTEKSTAKKLKILEKKTLNKNSSLAHSSSYISF